MPDLPKGHPDFLAAYVASTRASWRRMLDDIDARYGDGRMVDLEPRHVRQDLARLAPIPANNRLKVWRALGRWWYDSGLVEANPTAGWTAQGPENGRPHTVD